MPSLTDIALFAFSRVCMRYPCSFPQEDKYLSALRAALNNVVIKGTTRGEA